MAPRRTLRLTCLGLAWLALACVTINVYFPEAAVKDLSQQIEEAVARAAAQGKAAAPEETTPEATAEPSGGSRNQAPLPTLARHTVSTVIGSLLWLTAPEAIAQGDQVASPEISNPAIRAIIRSRAARIEEIRRHKNTGVLGEDNQALLSARALDSLALKDRAAVQRLIKDENADRERMFKEIAAATSTDLSQLPRIQATYAETLRENAKPGDWIQLAGGEWRQKS